MKKKETRDIKTMIRLSKTEREDIEKISNDNEDGSLSATIRRLIVQEIKRVKNQLKGVDKK